MEESRRVKGARKAAVTKKELAEVRAKAYQFIRENPEVTSPEIAKQFHVGTGNALNWINHCRQHKKDLFTKTMPEGTQKIQRDKVVGLTFVQATETIIYAFEQAKLVPLLKEQVCRLENKLAATKNELDELRKYYQGKEDQAKRFHLAQQQGELKNL